MAGKRIGPTLDALGAAKDSVDTALGVLRDTVDKAVPSLPGGGVFGAGQGQPGGSAGR